MRYTEGLFVDKHIETQQVNISNFYISYLYSDLFSKAAFKMKKLILDGRRVELSIWVSTSFFL